MTTLTVFDHFSNQHHESIFSFFRQWEVGERKRSPWDDMNIPVGLSVHADDHCGEDCPHWPRMADILVFLPRKEHVKHVYVPLRDEQELELLRRTFVGIGEGLYAAAATKLEAFARGERDGLVLYYWDGVG